MSFLLGVSIKKDSLVKLYCISYDYEEYFLTRIGVNHPTSLKEFVNHIDHVGHEIKILKYYYKNAIENQTEKEFMDEEFKHINPVDILVTDAIVTEIDDQYFVGLPISNLENYDEIAEQFKKSYRDINEYLGEHTDICIKNIKI
jgi:hypothetical protein